MNCKLYSTEEGINSIYYQVQSMIIWHYFQMKTARREWGRKKHAFSSTISKSPASPGYARTSAKSINVIFMWVNQLVQHCPIWNFDSKYSFSESTLGYPRRLVRERLLPLPKLQGPPWSIPWRVSGADIKMQPRARQLRQRHRREVLWKHQLRQLRIGSSKLDTFHDFFIWN